MNFINRKNIFLFFVLLFMITFSSVYSSSVNTKESDTKSNENEETKLLKALKELKLSIAVVVSDNKDALSRLAFIAKNNSTMDITIDDFRTGYNGVEVVYPNGKSGFNSFQTSTDELITIKSSDTKIWYIDPARFLISRQEEGLYKIKWNIGDVVESQEFLLLNEKNKEEVKDNKS